MLSHYCYHLKDHGGAKAVLSEQHPDKTFVGRVERGFDFLGYFIKPGGLRLSRGTFERFAGRISRLYEQSAVLERIGEYMKHWFKWVRTGRIGMGLGL